MMVIRMFTYQDIFLAGVGLDQYRVMGAAIATNLLFLANCYNDFTTINTTEEALEVISFYTTCIRGTKSKLLTLQHAIDIVKGFVKEKKK